MMGIWTLRTTHMDDLMVSLQRLQLPQSVTIPLVVMFRYIPTLRIEYRMIRNTMDIRGISDTLWKRLIHPISTVEYILIPLWIVFLAALLFLDYTSIGEIIIWRV